MSSKSKGAGAEALPTQSDSYAWLFLPEELEELYMSPQPVEGDILLLNSKSITGIASRVAQKLGKYSHVGIVIGADLYIDAVSKQGVQIRRVADLVDPKQHYSIGDCIVLRSHSLVRHAPEIWSKSTDYLDRPYRLHGVFTKPNGAFDDRDPVICSKLVAMILGDVNVRIKEPLHSILPKDFDLKCKGANWRRFSLAEYDILSNPQRVSTERKNNTKYWLDMLEPLQKIGRSFRTLMRSAHKKP